MGKAKFSEIIPFLYDAVLEPERWDVSLDYLLHALGARGSVLVQRQQGTEQLYEPMRAMGAYRDLLASPDGDFYLKNLVRYEAPLWALLEERPAQTPTFDSELVSHISELDDVPSHVFLRDRWGVHRKLAVKINEDRGWYEALTVGFGERDGAKLGHIGPALQPLLPHLSKAVELSRTFALLRAKYQAVLSVLDRVTAGLAIALPSGEIIVENAAARQLFDEANGISLARSRHIRVDNAMADADLHRRIADAALASNGQSDQFSSMLRIERRGGGDGIIVDISPLAESSGQFGIRLNGALILFIDPARPPQFDVKAFAKLYSLTAAEKKICGLLVSGMTTENIAEMRSTTVETTRTQIKQILGKTRTQSRAGLLLLLFKTIPPII